MTKPAHELPVLRAMKEVDLDAVMAVERRAYEFPWSHTVFRDSIRYRNLCWVYEDRTGLVGHGVMILAAGEAQILNVCVDPARQGQGLGRRLMAHMLRHARETGADSAFLEVRESNQAAYRLYLSLGFDEIGRRRDYYPTRTGKEDAVLMAMPLL